MKKETTDILYILIGILALVISILLAILFESPEEIKVIRSRKENYPLIPVSEDTVVISAEDGFK